jgi:CelD/BcsL family acetyltransferase involved in cellulose biosynthesis
MTTELATLAIPLDVADTLTRDRGAFGVQLVTDINDAFLDECERLLAAHARPGNVFQQRAIAAAALHPEKAREQQAVFAVVSRDSQIISILPLRLARHFGILVASDLAAPVSQYADVIGQPLGADDLAAITAGLQTQFRADALLLRRMRDDSGLVGAFADMAPASVTTTSAAPFINLAAYGRFAAYAARFGKKTNRMRKQRRQKLEELHGPLSFATFRGRQGRDKLVMALQWKRDWLVKRGLSSTVFDGGSNEAMLRRIGDSEAMCVSVLSAGGRPVAIELGLVHSTHYAAYLGAFDPALTRFSPGQEQMLRTLEWCFAQGFTRYDLLPPDDDYKLIWTETKEPVRDHCVALSPLGTGYVLLRRLAHSRMQSVLRTLPDKARRYGPAAVGMGAAAAVVGILAD